MARNCTKFGKNITKTVKIMIQTIFSSLSRYTRKWGQIYDAFITAESNTV